MKNFKLTVNNAKYFVQEVYRLLKSQCEYEVNIREWSDKRSLPANAVCHTWYPVIAEYIGSDILTVKCRSKIDFGLPILLNNGSEYSDTIIYILKELNFWNLMYEDQERLISGFKVTSEMNTKECNLYRDNLQAYWQQNGLILEYKTKK